MYIQITTYCNMSCEHCCFSCEAGKKGEHISVSDFRKAVKLAEYNGEYITLGGGEPTMHPEFWTLLGIALESDCDYIWMATNGSITKRALALAKMAHNNERFGIALSQDYYHDPIEDEVIDTFKLLNVEIRDVTKSGTGVNNAGAAKENGIGEQDSCSCPNIHIKPNGKIFACGCDDSLQLGTVDNFDGELYSRNIEVLQEQNEYCGSKLNNESINYILTGEGELELAA